MVATDKNFKQWQRQLDLFQDECGIWRCRGMPLDPLLVILGCLGQHVTQCLYLLGHVHAIVYCLAMLLAAIFVTDRNSQDL